MAHTPVTILAHLHDVTGRIDHGVIQKFGNSPNIGGAYEAIWDGGVTYPGWLSSATIPKVKSSAIVDGDGAKTGALTVEISGLSATWVEQSEIITLDGQNLVVATKTYIRVNRIRVLTAGSGGVNAGIIYCYNNAADTVLAQVTIGMNQTLMALWSVPVGKSAFMEEMYFGAAANKTDTVGLFVRPFGETFQVKKLFHVKQASFQYNFVSPLVIAAKSDIVVRALSDTPGSPATAGFTAWYTDS